MVKFKKFVKRVGIGAKIVGSAIGRRTEEAISSGTIGLVNPYEIKVVVPKRSFLNTRRRVRHIYTRKNAGDSVGIRLFTSF